MDSLPQAVKDGECAQEPDKLSKKGYRFIGWRVVLSPWDLDAENFNFSTPITKDITLKAFYISEKEHSGEPFDIVTLDGAPVIDAANMADVAGTDLTKKEIKAGYILLLVSSPLAEADIPSADKAALEGETNSLGASCHPEDGRQHPDGLPRRSGPRRGSAAPARDQEASRAIAGP